MQWPVPATPPFVTSAADRVSVHRTVRAEVTERWARDPLGEAVACPPVPAGEQPAASAAKATSPSLDTASLLF
jgi:hypothetical protein